MDEAWAIIHASVYFYFIDKVMWSYQDVLLIDTQDYLLETFERVISCKESEEFKSPLVVIAEGTFFRNHTASLLGIKYVNI